MLDTQTPNVWIIIPARGGSRAIPRKNVRTLGTKPLILHVLQELTREFSSTQMIVSTDSAEIASLSSPYARIHHRTPSLANDTATLDEVAVEVANWLLEQGASQQDILLTIQPTSPFLRCMTVRQSIEKLTAGANSVITVRDDRHLRWTLDTNGQAVPLYTHRVNRQWQPPTFAETGGLFGARLGDIIATKTRINPPVDLIIVDEIEGLDIDSYADWAVAQFYLQRQRILIRADASPELGMGHVYRALALANQLASHDLMIVTRADGAYALGERFLMEYPYPVQSVKNEAAFFALLATFLPALVILDILDTSEDFVRQVKAAARFVVSLEDLGPGSLLADLVINDLYSDLYPRANHWYGLENALLAPQFETFATHIEIRQTVETILVTFGGTDPANHTVLALSALQEIGFAGETIVVLGPGYQHERVVLQRFGLYGEVLSSISNMALTAARADLAITSAGRTVTELMSLGIPTIVLCQNLRELRHTHASSLYGIMNLGLGQYVSQSTLANHVRLLMDSYMMRHDMHIRAIKATRNRSNQKIVGRILNAAFPQENQ